MGSQNVHPSTYTLLTHFYKIKACTGHSDMASGNMKNLEHKPGLGGSLAIHSLGLPLPISQEVVLSTYEVLVSTELFLHFCSPILFFFF